MTLNEIKKILLTLPEDVEDVVRRLDGFETAVAEVYADSMPGDDAPQAQVLYKRLAKEFLMEFAFNDCGAAD